MKLDQRSLDCDRARDMMFDYIDGELNNTETELLEAHIKGCEACRREHAERREMLELIKLAGSEPVPALHDRVAEAIAEVPQYRRSLFTRLRYLPAGTLVAACAVVMVLLVGRGYIFGGAADAVMDVEDKGILLAGVRPTEAFEDYADEDADGAYAAGVADCAEVPEAADMEIAVDAELDAEPEYYSITTASITAGSPKILADMDNAAVTYVETESVIITKSAKAPTASELDLFYESVRNDGAAVIVCYNVLPELYEGLSGESFTSPNGTEYVLYTVTDGAKSLYSDHCAALSTEGASFRAYAPDGAAECYLLYVLTDLES